MSLRRLARRPTPPVQGYDTDAKRARNFALQLPLPGQIICLRQLRRDFHPRVVLSHSSLPVAVTSISFTEQPRQLLFFGQPDQQRCPLPEKASFYGRVVRSVVGEQGVRMNIDDSRLIVRFQRLIDRNAGRETVGTAATGVN